MLQLPPIHIGVTPVNIRTILFHFLHQNVNFLISEIVVVIIVGNLCLNFGKVQYIEGIQLSE